MSLSRRVCPHHGPFRKNIKQTDHDLLVVAVAVKAVVEIAPSALKAAQNSEAIVVATEWKEFTTIDWLDVYSTMNKPAFVFDGRMILDAEKLRQIGFKVRHAPRPVPRPTYTD